MMSNNIYWSYQLHDRLFLLSKIKSKANWLNMGMVKYILLTDLNLVLCQVI